MFREERKVKKTESRLDGKMEVKGKRIPHSPSVTPIDVRHGWGQEDGETCEHSLLSRYSLCVGVSEAVFASLNGHKPALLWMPNADDVQIQAGFV